jgi:Domain of unknown function (DUF4138)
MRSIILTILIAFSSSVFSQQSLDTIYANEQKAVALFFPKPIRQGIVGKSHFVFNYNKEESQYLGLLQATPGTESNLLTITNDGQVYSYILKYAHELPKLNYFIEQKESIGNEKPKVETLEIEKKIVNPYINRITYFQKFSEYLLESEPERMATKRKKGMRLRLQKMVYNVSKVYLVIEIENKSGIDFEIDYLNIYRTNGNSKRKASFQRLQQKVIYKHKMPSIIKDEEVQQFVYVLPKFVLGDNEKLLIELKELKGSRSVILKTKL